MEFSEYGAVPLIVVTRQQDHVEIINSTLRNAGCAVHCHWVRKLNDVVDTLTQINAQLAIVVCKDSTETQAALRTFKQCAAKLGVLLIREQIDEDIMAEAMQLGARDVLTLNHTARLQAVVARELYTFWLERNLYISTEASREYREQLRNLMAESTDAIAHVVDGIIIDVNPAWVECFQLKDTDTAVGQPLMDSFDAATHTLLKSAMVACLQKRWANEPLKAAGVASNGKLISLDLQLELVEIDAEPTIKISANTSTRTITPGTVTVKPTAEKGNADLGGTTITGIEGGMLDATTGLLQRRHFVTQLRALLSEPLKAGARIVVSVEPDKYTAIAEKLGPTASEEFVAQFFSLLQQSLSLCTLGGRFGDCTFVGLLQGSTRIEVETLCKTVLQQISNHVFVIAGKSLGCTCSIGLGMVDIRATNLDTPLTDALHARRLAAEQGGDRLHITDHSDDETRTQANDSIWVQLVKHALSENRFRLMQQPIASLLGNQSDLHDVLIRMIDPQGNEVLPAEFMAAAERNDLLKLIDRWVITATMPYCISGTKKSVFVRLSKDSMLDASLPVWINNQLKASRVDPTCMVFALDTQMVADHLVDSQTLMTKLRPAGFKFALEHFSADRDALRSLEKLPIDFLKIDGGIIEKLAKDDVLQEQVRKVLAATRSKNVRTIAERVEDANTMAILWQLGIEYIQGYFVQEPERVTLGVEVKQEQRA